MAKKKKQFHGIHITPKAGTHYEVRHEPKMEPAEKGDMPTMQSGGDDQKNEKLFAHGERGALHKHIDDLMDAHEGMSGGEGAETDADDMPPAADHPMHKLRRKM
jgi:hypothetical protein